MRTKTIFLIILCICTAPLCSTSQKVKMFFGDDIIDIIRNPDRVESYKLKPKKSKKGKTLHGYPIVKKGNNLTTEQISSLTSILLDEKTYDFTIAKKGFIFPEYAFIFQKGENRLTVLVCYYRKELMFFHGNRELKEDFDSALQKMKSITNKLFYKK